MTEYLPWAGDSRWPPESKGPGTVHTGSSPWRAECPVWNPFKTLTY